MIYQLLSKDNSYHCLETIRHVIEILLELKAVAFGA